VSGLFAPLATLKGVGPEREKTLAAADLSTRLDLLLLTPHAYARWPAPMAQPSAGRCSFLGTFERARVGRLRGRQGGFLELVVRAGESSQRARWYGRGSAKVPWTEGERLLLVGRGAAEGSGPFVLERCESMPDEESLARALARLHPRWPTVNGLAAGTLRSLIARALEDLNEDPLAGFLPRDTLALSAAFRQVHEPRSEAEVAQGMERLLFDRFVALLVAMGTSGPEAAAPVIAVTSKVADRIRARLPFELTASQQSVLQEILSDLMSTRPMRRVLQGDVGSGKTAVAVAAALATVAAGRRVLFVAPTQVLAAQQHALLTRWLKGSRVRLALKTSGSAHSERELAAADIITGTHAILRAQLQMNGLGLVIIDEQHRFGVRNRLAAVRKGAAVHALSMSATPIPRTLLLTLLGNLPRSHLRGMPPQRAGTSTRIVGLADALQAVQAAATRGERSFVVFPAIAAEGVPALLREGMQWKRRELKAWPAAVVHGGQSADERQAGLDAFRDGRALILFATVVVEVGLDVPEATQMVICGAERHGLATLHQLRGRVGRGEKASVCHLVPSGSAKREALLRLEALVQERDGFRLAEEDLAQRGPGEVLGVRQAGHGGLLHVARQREDLLWQEARTTAAAILAADAALAREYLLALHGAVSPEFRPEDAL